MVKPIDSISEKMFFNAQNKIEDSSKLGCPNPCKNYIYFDLVVSYNQADPSALLPHVNEETL